jgi:hypothetical protein
MNLKYLSDAALLRKLDDLASLERNNLLAFLHCLREVESRKLYSELGYTSLFDYCTKKLRYPEDQAQRRIVAMRAMRELPELEAKISRGLLTLTAIGMAVGHIRREGIQDRSIKIKLLESLEGLTSREVECLLIRQSSIGIPLPTDRIRLLKEGLVELRFAANASVREKIENVKGRIAHSQPQIPLGALFDLLLDWGLEKSQRNQPAAPRVTPHQSRASLRTQIFARDHHRCTQCHSTHALELDHIVPKAKGGATTLDNLRVLCRPCNQRAAIREYGQEKMDQYL